MDIHRWWWFSGILCPYRMYLKQNYEKEDKTMARIITFVMLALLSAYEEIMQLIQRGSWHIGMTWLPIWETAWDGKWKLFDSHHFIFGLFVLAFACVLRMQPKYFFKLQLRFFSDKWNTWITEGMHIVIVWWAFFWIRNIGMHVLFMRSEYIRWEYLLPIQF